MEQVNFEFLSSELKFLGFGESLLSDLKEMIEKENDSFELHYRNKIGDDPIEAILYFLRSDPAGFFFFTKYIFTAEGKSQVFFIFKGKGITVKEAYNLLQGRAVFKQRTARNNQKYNEWIELDLSVKDDSGYRPVRYPESHGFDIVQVLASMAIDTPTANWDRSMLIKSLEKGNLQAAFIQEGGVSRKVFIRANPRDKNIIVHEPEPEFWIGANEASIGDDIENALRNKPSRAKRLKDVNL